MTTEIVSGWHDDDTVYLLERKPNDKFKLHKRLADWSFFLKGADQGDRDALVERDSRIVASCTEGSEYSRFDCRDRWARKNVVDALTNSGIPVCEGDVSPLTRFMSNKDCEFDVAKDFKLGFFDLETDSRKTFEEAIEGKASVLSWALCDVEGNHWEGVVSELDPLAAPEDMEVDPDSEREELKSFLKAAEKFDVLLAWNGEGFDFPVLEERCKRIGVKALWNQWNLLDQLEVYKKYNVSNEGSGEQKMSFKLEHVAQYQLGEGKHDFDASKTWEAWAAGGKSRQEMLDYNVQDTALLPRIEAKAPYIALHFVVCKICRIFPHTRSLNATNMGDGFLLRLGDEFDYRFPTRQHTDNPEKFMGAYVMDPTRCGAIDNVHVADFAGLYPSIMRTFNMSLETKLKEPNGTCCQLPDRATYFETTKRGMVPVALDRLVAQRGEYQKKLAQAKPHSEAWIKYKQLSSAFKIIANSFYGIVGSPWSRFFDKDVAEGVTQTGKWLLMQVIAESKRAGLDPFYGDTDSVFVAGDPDEFQKVVDYLNQSWAERLREWGVKGDHYIKLEFEKSFTRLIMLDKKKRYAGSVAGYKGQGAEEDAKEIKGLEYRRGDTIVMARNAQKELIDVLLRRGDLPNAAQIWKMVNANRKMVLDDVLTLESVTLSKGIHRPIETYGVNYTKETCTGYNETIIGTGEYYKGGAKKGQEKTKKNRVKCIHDFKSKGPTSPSKCPFCDTKRNKTSSPAHVRVAYMMLERGESVREGDRIFYVVAKNPDPKDKKLYPMPAHWDGALQQVDRNYYWSTLVYPPCLRILEVVYPGEPWSDALK